MDDYALYWAARGGRRSGAWSAGPSGPPTSRSSAPGSGPTSARPPAPRPPTGSSTCPTAPRPRRSPRRRSPGPAPPPPDLAHLPRPLLGFVGSLEDRIDWPLVERVARGFPGGSVVLIGREPAPRRRAEPWYATTGSAVALPNVHRLGWRIAGRDRPYNAAFDVCLIPYRADHPFNRACLPDEGDGLHGDQPAGRLDRPARVPPLRPPVRRRRDPAAFVAAIRRIVDRGSDDGRAPLRWEHARAATWEHTADALLDHYTARLAAREPGPAVAVA